LNGADLGSWLDLKARQYGPNTALAMGETRLSYTSLKQESDHMARALQDIGVNPGDRVALLLGNCPELVITYFGIVKCGAVAVPLDPKYKSAELTALLCDCQPRVLISDNPTLDAQASLWPGFSSLTVITVSPEAGECRYLKYHDIMSVARATPREQPRHGRDIANINYTSGPSLRPKGVLLSHALMVTVAEASRRYFQQTEKDITVLFALPLHHIMGLGTVLLASLASGGTVVLVPGISVDTLLKTIDKERATIFMGVPFIFVLMNNEAEVKGLGRQLRGLRLVCAAGAPLSVHTITRFKEIYGPDIVQFYGLTEVTAHLICQPIDGSGIPGSIGRALPEWETAIVDSGSQAQPSGADGELLIRGPMMAGYYRHPEATARTIRNGWLHTGDMARADAAGNIFITGRQKDMIIVKGQNIYPTDIEDVLRQHPGVAEVAVTGIPDELRGEIVCAYIVPAPGAGITEEEARRLCRTNLANYKIPKLISLRSSLPHTPASRLHYQVE
jgi:long-chain acyl-CoA synthetase